MAGDSDEHHAEDHHSEDPGVWGWHGEFGRSARVAGIVVAIILLLMMTATHYNWSGGMWLGLFALALIVGVIWDARRSKYSWRK